MSSLGQFDYHNLPRSWIAGTPPPKVKCLKDHRLPRVRVRRRPMVPAHDYLEPSPRENFCHRLTTRFLATVIARNWRNTTAAGHQRNVVMCKLVKPLWPMKPV